MTTLTGYSELAGDGVASIVFDNPSVYIKTVKEGIQGKVLKQAVSYIGERDLFVRVLNTTSGNLSRFFQKKLLSCNESEQVLDTLKVYRYANSVFGDASKTKEFFNMHIPALNGEKPIELLDTFAGRRLVQDMLRKVEYGEFS
ncbi:MAG: putative toxin-antitoxin system antitoxin component (TIGR02293 family) [Phenylobacterium sp.]|jgi:putative toxin-antitoxin system antitoxin component (TIGR02293 family)